jgi:hypothetical protein
MILKMGSWIARRPKLSFLGAIAAFFIAVLFLFLLGAYIDFDKGLWWAVLVLVLASAASVFFSFIYLTIFYQKVGPFCLKKYYFGHAFVFLLAMISGVLLTFLVIFPFYLYDHLSFISEASFASLGLPFAFLLLVSIVSVGARYDGQLLSSNHYASVSSSFAQKVNSFMCPFLISYFLLISAPYCFALVPSINAFFVGTITKMAYRGLTCLYFFGYSFLLMKANKTRLNWSWAVLLLSSVTLYVLAWLLVPKEFSYYVLTSNNILTFYDVSIGNFYIFVAFGSYTLECLVFLCLISFFPRGITSKKAVIFPLLVVILLTLSSCIFSVFRESNKYLAFFTSSSDPTKSIASWYHSKNAFGIFLFNGSVSSLFLFCFLHSKWRFSFVIIFLVFFGFSYVIQCNTAAVSSGVVGLVLLFIYFSKTKRRFPWLFYSVLTIICLIVLGVVLGTTIPQLRSHFPPFQKIYISLEKLTTDEVYSRTGLWNYCLSLIKGPFVLVGETDVIANTQLTMIERMNNNTMFDDFHSAFVSFYSAHGLCGLCLYLGAHAYALKQICLVKKTNPLMYAFLFDLFIGAVLFSMPETYTLFISMSASVFPISLMLLVYPTFLSGELKGTKGPSSSDSLFEEVLL